MASTLLYIYDDDDFSIHATALIRQAEMAAWGAIGLQFDVYPVPISGGTGAFQVALNGLVAQGKEFTHALIETHGATGTIYFGNQTIRANDLYTTYWGMGYEKIFPYINTRIYFNGCNVADDPKGWDFLDAAGRVFLKKGGGITFASTELGRVIIFTGHVHHFGSKTSYSVVLPGGHLMGHVNE